MTNKEIAHVALKILGFGAVVTVVLIAPNAAGEIIKFAEELADTPERDRRRAVSYLKTQGYARVAKSPAGPILHLTSRGSRRVRKLALEGLTIEKPRVWDGKWRVVFFDIPTKPRHMNDARDAVRSALKRLGFVSIQKSVWAHPYPCDEVVSEVVDYFRVRPYVGVVVASEISNEAVLKEKFGFG